MKLENKVAIVTGGAMGNGLGIVKVFLKYGAKVVIFDYSDEINNVISSINNPNLSGYKVDIRDKERVNAITKNKIIEQIILNFIAFTAMNKRFKQLGCSCAQ